MFEPLLVVWVWLSGMCEMGLPEGPSDVALPLLSYEPLKGDSEIVVDPTQRDVDLRKVACAFIEPESQAQA